MLETLKKIKLGSVELLGYLGIIIWVAVILLREYSLFEGAAYLFWLGILPNLGAAWAFTMFLRWGVVFVLKKEITTKKHLLICTGVLILALISEIVHDGLLNSPFDSYDMLITAAAQAAVFLIPILVKDKYFSGYTH